MTAPTAAISYEDAYRLRLKLMIAGEDIPVGTILDWSAVECSQAGRYAIAVYLASTGSLVDLPSRPAFLPAKKEPSHENRHALVR